MPGRARLPDNLSRNSAERARVQAMHASGDLMRLHLKLASRLADYRTEADRHGLLYSGGAPLSDNTLFCLLRGAAPRRAAFPLPQDRRHHTGACAPRSS